MSCLHVGNTYVELDKEGFLNRMDEWNEDVALAIAQHEGVTRLSREKMEIVKYLRKHYLKFANFPILKSVCKRVKSSSVNCVSEEFKNPMIAWKIAGLPKPSNVFFNSFDGEEYFSNPVY